MTSEEKINRLIEISRELDRIAPVNFDETVAYALMLQDRGIDPKQVLNKDTFLDFTGFDVGEIAAVFSKFKIP